MTDRLLSIIIPVYDSGTSLEECLVSLLPLQDSGRLDVVVVDDGSSTDESERIDRAVSKVGQQLRVHVERLPHSGAGKARNRGIALADGEFVWFVDADDTLNINHVEGLLQTLNSLPKETDVLFTGHMLSQSSEKQELQIQGYEIETSEVKVENLLYPRCSALDHTTMVVRRSFLLQYSDVRYPEDMHILEDSLFALRVIDRACHICLNSSLHPYIHHTYRQSTTSGAWSTGRSRCFVPDICRFFSLFCQFAESHQQVSVRQCYCRYRYVYLRVLAVKGCPWNDISEFRQAVSPLNNPTSFCEALLFNAMFHRAFAFICRNIRH